jgi:hypothetical protein
LGVRAKRFAFGASEKPANEIQQALLNKPQFQAITADIILHTDFSQTLSTALDQLLGSGGVRLRWP